ncbi:MAG: imidazole glycerol phosphate synthase subunit HisH [Moorellales bacterium]
MLAVIDYGMGNLRSVHKALERLGYAAVITSDPHKVERARGIVLPGVGAFADAARRLAELGLDQVIRRAVAAGRPFLGICLGLQLLFEGSEENGWHEGLGIFPGRVRRLGPGLKVPHMGWNQVEQVRPSPLFAGIPDGTPFYFVHSYYADPADPDLVLARTDYGGRFACTVGRGAVFGVQFHPEKSSRWGLKLLSNFGEMVARCS